MSRVCLVIPPCPAHNDSCVCGVALTRRHACHLESRKESPHEDRPPSDPFTPTYARRSADPQLLAPHHRRVSAQCRPVCQTLPYVPRSFRPRAHPHLPTRAAPPAGLRERLHPDGLCLTLFL